MTVVMAVVNGMKVSIPLTHSLLTHSLTHSPTYSLTYSLAYSLTHLLTHLVVKTPIFDHSNRVKLAENAICSHLKGHFGQLHHMLKKIDKSNSGKVSYSEFKAAIAKTGAIINENDLQLLYKVPPQSLTYSLTTHSLTYLLTHLLTYSLTHSLKEHVYPATTAAMATTNMDYGAFSLRTDVSYLNINDFITKLRVKAMDTSSGFNR